MLKGILSISKLDDLKAYRLLSTTAIDVGKLDEVRDLDEASVGPKNLARLALATRYIKVF